MSLITEPCVITSMSDAEYHADPVAGGSLSSSGAKEILRSPAHYQWSRTHRVERRVFDVGHAAHALILGTGMEVVEVDADSWRTADAKKRRDDAYAEGKTPLLTKDAAPIRAMADAVLAHSIAGPLLERAGQSEVSLFAPDPESGVWLRARPDRLPDAASGPPLIVDLKTARSASPRDFTRSAADFGYDIQRALYTHVLSLTRGDADADFAFIVVETEAPHLVSVVELDDEYTRIGQARMRRAIDLYKTCRDADEWPGYDPIVHLVDAPRWLAYEEGMVL